MCVPLTFIIFIPFYLVDARHFQNHIVAYFLAFLALPLPLHHRHQSSLTKGSAGTDQAILFQVTAAGTTPSINYRTENDTD